jgi:protoheme IX farnesyltransferase
MCCNCEKDKGGKSMANSKAFSEAPINKTEQSLQAEIPKTSAWRDFLALIKIGIVNSNMITVFTGLWLALHFSEKSFLNNLDIVFYTLIGSTLIMAGSCSINNYFDRDIDRFMERTKERPTVTGRVHPTKVLIIGFSLILIGIIFLLLTTISAVIIGAFGIFSYVVLYTLWTKRRYVSNTIVGGISGAVPPLIGWAAVDGNLDITAWGLFLIMFVWQPPHFYALAMRRVEEYRTAGIPMLPVVKGFDVTKRHIIAWIMALFPIPLLLTSIGMPFIILATILNIGWLALGLYGYKKSDPIRWSKSMFIYSLQYMTIMFVAMVIITLI